MTVPTEISTYPFKIEKEKKIGKIYATIYWFIKKRSEIFKRMA